MRACTQVRALFFYILRWGDENPRPGFDNWQRQLDRPRACERAAPTKTPGAFLNNACVGPAGASEASQSPPHRHIRDESLYASTGFFLLYSPLGGMRTPDRGSTTGAASWTDREPASGLPRRGERSESIPPSPPYFKKSSYASTGFFSSVAPAGGMRTPDQGSTTGNRHYAVLSKPDSFSHD